MSLGIEQRGSVRVLTIARPEVRNALDGPLIAALAAAYAEAAREDGVRAVLLRSAGSIFCAGADLAWMRKMAEASFEENLADARALADLMRRIDVCSKPTIVAVQGAAMAGALGLIAASDIVVAAPEAEFAVTEVRLGLVPAIISPYLVRAVGARQARRLILSAHRLDAAEALRLGLVHEIADDLDAATDRIVAAILKGGPAALAEAKRLVRDVAGGIEDGLIDETAARIARIRASKEGQEGLAAFLERRRPGWQE